MREKMFKLMPLIFLIGAGGCASIESFDRELMTKFEMTSSNTWRMSVGTAANYPPDDESSESTRKKWIADHAKVNGCNNFSIKSRMWTKKPTDNFMVTGFSKSVGTLYYSGDCGS